MRAAPSDRETSDLKDASEELRDLICDRTRRLVNTGCVIAFANEDTALADEARIIVMELNAAVHEYDEVEAELVERGEF